MDYWLWCVRDLDTLPNIAEAHQEWKSKVVMVWLRFSRDFNKMIEIFLTNILPEGVDKRKYNPYQLILYHKVPYHPKHSSDYVDLFQQAFFLSLD